MFVAIFRRCFRPLALACLRATGGKTLSTIARPLFPLILVAGFGSDAFAQATVPGAPVLRDVLLGNGQLTVRWRAPENTGSGITRYKVTADPGTPDSPSDDTTCPSTETGGTATTCTLTGLTNGTAYTVRVVATNSAGDSTPSVSVAATPSLRDAGGRIYVYPNGDTDFERYPKLDNVLAGMVARSKEISESFLVEIIIDTHANMDVIKRYLSDNGVVVPSEYMYRDPNGRGTIEAYITASLILPLSNQPSVVSMRYPIGFIPYQPPADPAPPRTPAVAHKIIAWHLAGYDGTGVKVGVIDQGFQDFSTNFPTRTIQAYCHSSSGMTRAVADCETRSNHGTKVTQSLLHIAPKVSLYISNPSKKQLRNAVNWMIDQGVQVINHSGGWPWDGPGDGSSPDYNSPLNAVDTAVVSNIIWVNAAGNDAKKTWYSDSLTWTSSSTDTSRSYLVFDSGDTCNTVTLNSTRAAFFQLRWKGNTDGTWEKANIDLNLYLLNSAGTAVASSTNKQSGKGGKEGHYPYEWIHKPRAPFHSTLSFYFA